jgi:hypothetical protein
MTQSADAIGTEAVFGARVIAAAKRAGVSDDDRRRRLPVLANAGVLPVLSVWSRRRDASAPCDGTLDTRPVPGKGTGGRALGRCPGEPHREQRLGQLGGEVVEHVGVLLQQRDEWLEAGTGVRPLGVLAQTIGLGEQPARVKLELREAVNVGEDDGHARDRSPRGA